MRMTEEELDAYYHFCIEQLDVKQEKLYEEYGVGTFEDYSFNQEEGVLQFQVDGEEVVAFEVALIGTLSLKSATWLWAWANQDLKEELRQKSVVLKEIKETTGYEVFENSQFDCDEVLAEGLAAFSLEQLRAKGMYVIPTDNRYVYLALLQVIER